MATTSEVKVALDDIANVIAAKRGVLTGYKAGASDISTALSGLLNDHADAVATIEGYGTTDAFEANAKALLTQLTAELETLTTSANVIATTAV